MGTRHKPFDDAFAFPLAIPPPSQASASADQRSGRIDLRADTRLLRPRQWGYASGDGELRIFIDPAPGDRMRVSVEPLCRMYFRMYCRRRWGTTHGKIGLRIEGIDPDGRMHVLANWMQTLWQRRRRNYDNVWRQTNRVPLWSEVDNTIGWSYRAAVHAEVECTASGVLGYRGRLWGSMAFAALRVELDSFDVTFT